MVFTIYLHCHLEQTARLSWNSLKFQTAFTDTLNQMPPWVALKTVSFYYLSTVFTKAQSSGVSAFSYCRTPLLKKAFTAVISWSWPRAGQSQPGSFSCRNRTEKSRWSGRDVRSNSNSCGTKTPKHLTLWSTANLFSSAAHLAFSTNKHKCWYLLYRIPQFQSWNLGNASDPSSNIQLNYLCLRILCIFGGTHIIRALLLPFPFEF